MSSRVRIAAYAAAGILIAALVITAVALGPTLLFPTKNGTLDIKVTDAPTDLKSLNITIDSFEVHGEENDSWTNVTIAKGQVTFDLVKLRNVTQDAALSQIPPGNYTKIRMHVLSAYAQLDNGTMFQARFPPDRIDIIVHFEVKTGQTTGILIDISVNTIKIAENPQSNITPVIKATVTPPA